MLSWTLTDNRLVGYRVGFSSRPRFKGDPTGRLVVLAHKKISAEQVEVYVYEEVCCFLSMGSAQMILPFGQRFFQPIKVFCEAAWGSRGRKFFVPLYALCLETAMPVPIFTQLQGFESAQPYQRFNFGDWAYVQA